MLCGISIFITILANTFWYNECNNIFLQSLQN